MRVGWIADCSASSGYSDYTYEDSTGWLAREIWHAAISSHVFDPSTEFTLSAVEGLKTGLVRYW